MIRHRAIIVRLGSIQSGFALQLGSWRDLTLGRRSRRWFSETFPGEESQYTEEEETSERCADSDSGDGARGEAFVLVGAGG